jgi:hypothetical protein|tara:strand:+ start:383 stop:1087 length:705 start_codon:yes stop_codon:yes gene_type:complete
MYTSLDEIIKSLLLQLELAGEHSYFRFFELARIGLRELTFDTARHVKTSLLVVNTATNSALLPVDFVSYVKVGIPSSDGKIEYLAQNNDLYMGAIHPNSLVPSSDTTTGGSPSYGKGGGQNTHGEYRLNREANTIELSSNISGTQLVLEYITDGLGNVDSDSEVQIHSFLSEALKTYIYWSHIKYKRDFSATDKDMAKKDFYNQKRLARARSQGMTKDEALVQSRKHQRQSPKH